MPDSIRPIYRTRVEIPRTAGYYVAPPVAQFRFAYATRESAFAAELTVPANSAAGVVLVVGVLVVVALVAASV